MSTPLEEPIEPTGASSAAAMSSDLPQCFSSLSEEWAAVRHRCGLLKAGFRTLWRLRGGDRTTFLQGMITNDVCKPTTGQGVYAALLTIQGRLVSDMHVFVLEDELWLDVPSTHANAVRENLEKFMIADDVEFASDAAWAPLAIVEGPQADRVGVAVIGENLANLKLFEHRSLAFAGAEIRAAAVSNSGERGYLLYGPPAVADALWNRCQTAGAQPVGMLALNVLRLEAGIPWMGRDMDETVLISEAGLGTAVSFQKGCYLGQEVVERVAARGQVQRKLVGLRLDGDRVPPSQTRLSMAGKDVGWITSAELSPAHKQCIALGYVRREAWGDADVMQASWADCSAEARIVALPFYRSEAA